MTKWIIVVDDDTANLKMADHILNKNNMRVTALKSGSAFLEYVNENGMPDLVLLDIKQFNDTRHEALTGRSNAQTLKSAQWLEENEKPFWLRYVLVPGISDFEEDIRALGEHFKGFKMLQRVEILPYHTLGKHKYESLGWEYKLSDTPHNTPEQLDRAVALFNEYFDCTVLN
jgi:pyruvate formate lyase activating enzyme